MRYRESKETVQDLNMSPLIDMVFILLIFFMVSTTFVKDMKLDLDRPSATSSDTASTKAVRVYVDNTGSVFIDGDNVRLWVVQSRLRDLLKTKTPKTVLVITDENVPSGQLIEVIDQARLAGASDVGVATSKEVGGS